MKRLGLLLFQIACWLLYAALAVHLVIAYGWTIMLLFLAQFALLWGVQYQVTAQRKEIDDLRNRLEKPGTL